MRCFVKSAMKSEGFHIFHEFFFSCFIELTFLTSGVGEVCLCELSFWTSVDLLFVLRWYGCRKRWVVPGVDWKKDHCLPGGILRSEGAPSKKLGGKLDEIGIIRDKTTWKQLFQKYIKYLLSHVRLVSLAGLYCHSFMLGRNLSRPLGCFSMALRPSLMPMMATWSAELFPTTYGCVWKCCVPQKTQWFCWSLSLLNGYFIGNIPYFQTNPHKYLPTLNKFPEILHENIKYLDHALCSF